MRFRWDPSKSAKCRAERGFDFDYASRVFSDPSHCIVDSSRRGEARYKVYGMIEGRVVVYTPRPGSIYRIISARKAKPREVREYEDSGN